MSPCWASVGALEAVLLRDGETPATARRRSRQGFNATLDVVTGELLAGALPASGLRAVRALLARHQSLALEAFHRTLQHDFPGTLDQQLEGDEADE